MSIYQAACSDSPTRKLSHALVFKVKNTITKKLSHSIPLPAELLGKRTVGKSLEWKEVVLSDSR